MSIRYYKIYIFDIIIILNNKLFRCPVSTLNGYPLSKYLSSFANYELSYMALEIACHAIESYCDKLKTGNYEDLIVKYIIYSEICHRAVIIKLCFRCMLIELS